MAVVELKSSSRYLATLDTTKQVVRLDSKRGVILEVPAQEFIEMAGRVFGAKMSGQLKGDVDASTSTETIDHVSSKG